MHSKLLPLGGSVLSFSISESY